MEGVPGQDCTGRAGPAGDLGAAPERGPCGAWCWPRRCGVGLGARALLGLARADGRDALRQRDLELLRPRRA